MTPEDLRLFVGREDVFAEQSEQGSYFPVRRPLTDDDLAEHLAGLWSIGTYTIDPAGQTVKYVVFDLDTFDTNLYDILQFCVMDLVDRTANQPFGAEEYPMLLMEKSGGKGFHVWLFFDHPVEAWRVVAWLKKEFWPTWNERTDNTPLEVFPKQDHVDEGRFGNLVKVPFGVHQKSGKRSEIVGVHGWVAQLDQVRGLSKTLIPHDPADRPKPRDIATVDTPTGILSSDGPVSRFLQGETAPGERNLTFHAFFTWTAWNIHLPSDLAWDWCQRLNDALPNPEDDEQSMLRTMESAYQRPPADAAGPRPPRGRPGGGDGYRRTPLKERLAARKGG